jgi:hypothetical protein
MREYYLLQRPKRIADARLGEARSSAWRWTRSSRGARTLPQGHPGIPATAIAERIGRERPIQMLSGPVAEVRPAYLPPDPASRTNYVADEASDLEAVPSKSPAPEPWPGFWRGTVVWGSRGHVRQLSPGRPGGR